MAMFYTGTGPLPTKEGEYLPAKDVYGPRKGEPADNAQCNGQLCLLFNVEVARRKWRSAKQRRARLCAAAAAENRAVTCNEDVALVKECNKDDQ